MTECYFYDGPSDSVKKTEQIKQGKRIVDRLKRKISRDGPPSQWYGTDSYSSPSCHDTSSTSTSSDCSF